MIRFLHTGDWHIGQLFHEYDRTYEHQQFLNWLVDTLQTEKIDVLLVSGDIFDLSNPAAASVKMFYTFLNQATKANPALQIIIIAGNHDSAYRLESPKPLLESSHIHITGVVERDAGGNIDYEKLVVPVYHVSGRVKAWCLAIPFLRLGDYPVVPESANPYIEGVSALYREATEYVSVKKQPDQVIIAMGHLHTQNAEITDLDNTERLIMGGVECIPVTAFSDSIQYVALGHIHKAQRVGGREHIRYSGSPLPMSFSELHYRHQVIIFDMVDINVNNIRSLEVPLSVPLLRVPSSHRPLEEVITALEQLPDSSAFQPDTPYLQVCVRLDGPEPALRHKVEAALKGKNVRLAKIDVKYPPKSSEYTLPVAEDPLLALQPLDIFFRYYESRYNTAVPEGLSQLFRKVTEEVNQQQE